MLTLIFRWSFESSSLISAVYVHRCSGVGVLENRREVFSEKCLGSLNSSKTFWDESLSGGNITGVPIYVMGGLQPN